ncbi:RNA polymerase sigma-70 factor, ECF subfamily [Arboricoccus pini]|uniref:RNA polymerase sigma-70 factor, ECF subfamily n=1 Tax=Arboricoccus pini TaxID=1963835 RepID=A0A212PX22_9PROT|nr:sigma-70 family RNA polymerase sigma factor [Arboricoccus pini]SNB51586.1 RNA polymerase sigma-70 factor, ECF subfamily [Arboricoccus pini]
MDDWEQSWSAAMRAERRGDAATYAWLLGEVAAYLRPRLCQRLARLGQGPDLAEDILQEVLLGIHLKRHTWEVDRPFTPWLAGIVRYKLMDVTRRVRREAGRRYVPEVAEWFEAIAAPIEDLDARLIDKEKPLADLPHKESDVVRALAIEGASVGTTARRLSISDGAVRLLFHRALARIRGRAVQALKDIGS